MPVDWDAYQKNLAAQDLRPGRHRLPDGEPTQFPRAENPAVAMTMIGRRPHHPAAKANRHNILPGATNRLIATPAAKAGITTIRINRNQKEENNAQ